jgi:hypothetical protein
MGDCSVLSGYSATVNAISKPLSNYSAGAWDYCELVTAQWDAGHLSPVNGGLLTGPTIGSNRIELPYGCPTGSFELFEPDWLTNWDVRLSLFDSLFLSELRLGQDHHGRLESLALTLYDTRMPRCIMGRPTKE